MATISQTATIAQQKAFVAFAEPLAGAISGETGLPTLFIVAHAAYESDWGLSAVAQRDCNYFGIMPGGKYGTYENPAAGFAAYAALICSPRYKGVGLVRPQDARTLARYLCSRGYNSVNSGYADEVAGVYTSVLALTATS